MLRHEHSREPDMNGRGFITISMHELERVKIIEAGVPRYWANDLDPAAPGNGRLKWSGV